MVGRAIANNQSQMSLAAAIVRPGDGKGATLNAFKQQNEVSVQPSLVLQRHGHHLALGVVMPLLRDCMRRTAYAGLDHRTSEGHREAESARASPFQCAPRQALLAS